MTPEIPDTVMTSGRLTRVPNQPKTPQKTFRVPEELYRAVQEKANANGDSISYVVRRCLQAYLDEPSGARDGGEPDGAQ